MAGDHAAQSAVATMSRKVRSFALVGGKDGTLNVSTYVRSMLMFRSEINLQGKLRGSQEKMDDPRGEER